MTDDFYAVVSPTQPEASSVVALLDMLHGSWKTQALCAAVELGIADHLAQGAQSPEELAAQCACHAPSLRRLLMALASLGICRGRDDGKFELASLGQHLRGDGVDSIRSWVLWWGRHLVPVWGELAHSIRTGREARSRVAGIGGFGQLESNPELAVLFNAAMVQLSRLVASSLARGYDFSGVRRIADLGGGHGEVLATLLESFPDSRGLLFDLPHAMPGARANLATRGVLDRCELIEGDFFQSVPRGADIYIMKSILHDWDDDRCVAILANCRLAMCPDDCMLLVEHILPERLGDSAEHHSLARLDLTMLVALGARERKEAEFRELLARAGFEATRLLPIEMGFHIIEAKPR